MKFSAECYITKYYGDDFDGETPEYEFEDVVVIGEIRNMSDEVDFRYNDDMKLQIKEEMEKRNLPSGEYHGYFVGELEYEHSYNWEYGSDDIDRFTSITEFHFYSISREEKE